MQKLFQWKGHARKARQGGGRWGFQMSPDRLKGWTQVLNLLGEWLKTRYPWEMWSLLFSLQPVKCSAAGAQRAPCCWLGSLEVLGRHRCGNGTWMGLEEAGTSPGMGNSKTPESDLRWACQGNGDTALQAPEWHGFIIFPDLSVQLGCLYSVLNVALWDLQDEALGGFRKLCCPGEAQLCLRNPG